MMDHEARVAVELLAPLRWVPEEAEEEVATAALRARVLPAMRTALRRSILRRRGQGRRRVLVAALGGVAAAAAVAFAIGLRPPASVTGGAGDEAVEVFVEAGRVVHRSADGDREVDAGRAVQIAANGVLATFDGGSARLDAGRVEIGLGSSTEVGLEELGPRMTERVRLHRGAVRCVVPSLGPGQGFSVVTPDATVVVHGTVFGVEVSPDLQATPRTCVSVEDGVVTVRHRGGIARLEAGERWGCVDEAPMREPAPAVASAASPTVEPSLAERARRRAALRVEAEALEEQNRLFRGALAAERRGEFAMAEAALQELLRRHPTSPLAGEARAMRTRLVARRAAVTP